METLQLVLIGGPKCFRWARDSKALAKQDRLQTYHVGGEALDMCRHLPHPISHHLARREAFVLLIIVAERRSTFVHCLAQPIACAI